MIPLNQCKNRKLYRVDARNFGIAVFTEAEKGFIGLRYKFGNTFPDLEYHWDTGAPHGTANPIEELPEELPEDICLDQNGPSICANCEIKVRYVPEQKRYEHLEPTHCNKLHAVIISNDAIEKWLADMKIKYKHIFI
jgi:hypothetical protein